MISVFPLFSYPVLISSENYSFSGSEETYMSELPMADNSGNLMSENDRILDCIELSKLRLFIDEQINIYKSKILNLKSGNDIYITQSWLNTAKTNQFHPRHKHPNSLISGVLFITGSKGDGMPPIRFHRSDSLIPLDLQYEELNDFNSGCRWFETVKGRLILFPSLVEHDVEKNNTENIRTSLSFNTFVRGKIGNKDHLTEITIG